MKFRSGFAALCLWVMLGHVVMASETLSPLQTIKGPIDRVIELLNDPAGKMPEQKEHQRKLIWQQVEPLFNFLELIRRAVGKDWERFSAEEQTRFQEVFSKFLANTYLDKIQGDFNNEKIIFISELVKDQLALARTKLVRETFELPIDYRMMQVDGQWKIYDVLVENGVSLVKNYRVQFVSALQKETPEQLIQRLEQKLKEQAGTLK
jgi:phospholipid transport system substrate-binding protein